MNARNVDINGKPTVISTFSGCGGSSLGYKWAGFREFLAIDFDENSVETFKLNFPDIPVWQRDINDVKGGEIIKFCKINKGELDLLDGSPPCQGFSTAGKRRVNDPRNSLFESFVRLINDLQPKVFVMENVSGMIKGRMKGMFLEVDGALKSTGYSVKCKLMNSMYYGVPQSRQRLIWIGVRPDMGKVPEFPEPNRRLVNVGMAWKGIKNKTFCREPSDKIKILYHEKLRPGISYSSGPGFSTKRLSFLKPSNTLPKTINSSLSLIMHPTECRSITIEEAKRLTTFPDDFKFIGKFEEQWARMGNAVMPKFMQAIAENIRNKILI